MRAGHGCLSERVAVVVAAVLVFALVECAHAQEATTGRRSLGPVFDSSWSFDGQRLVSVPSANAGRLAIVWELTSGRVHRFGVHNDGVRAVALSPDGNYLLTAGGHGGPLLRRTDNAIRLWDIESGRELRRFEGHAQTQGIHTVVFSPDGERIATVDGNHEARLWDVETGRVVLAFRHVADRTLPPMSFFSAEGSKFFGRQSHLVSVYSAARGMLLLTIAWDQTWQRGSFKWAEFSPDGAVLVTASKVVRTWDAATGAELRQLVGHESYVRQAIFTPDGRRILTASADRTARLWDIESGNEIRRFDSPGPLRSVLLAPDGTHFIAKWSTPASPNRISTASLWNIEAGREIKRITDDVDGLVGFSPDAKTFLVTRDHKPSALYETETGKLIREYER